MNFGLDLRATSSVRISETKRDFGVGPKPRCSSCSTQRSRNRSMMHPNKPWLVEPKCGVWNQIWCFTRLPEEQNVSYAIGYGGQADPPRRPQIPLDAPKSPINLSLTLLATKLIHQLILFKFNHLMLCIGPNTLSMG